MAEVYPPLEDLVQQARDLFKSNFDQEPSHGAFGPGRVNLIGEHTDYNNGFVLPMALPMVTVAVGRLNDTGFCRICTNR